MSKRGPAEPITNNLLMYTAESVGRCLVRSFGNAVDADGFVAKVRKGSNVVMLSLPGGIVFRFAARLNTGKDSLGEILLRFTFANPISEGSRELVERKRMIFIGRIHGRVEFQGHVIFLRECTTKCILKHLVPHTSLNLHDKHSAYNSTPGSLFSACGIMSP